MHVPVHVEKSPSEQQFSPVPAGHDVFAWLPSLNLNLPRSHSTHTPLGPKVWPYQHPLHWNIHMVPAFENLPLGHA